MVSAVFLPQRVQFLADSGGDSWLFCRHHAAIELGCDMMGLLTTCNML